ncbi:MAG: outer membrane lipoprotein-sorting protein [Cyclobacteriaceae bacterium]|jgi:outer membrane lipoprotein-sorting protein|nr:outer membrane lipoprotein-sorting protein [Cyclobacteriaceae bacterium]
MKRVFVALFVFCAAAAQAQTVDEILAKYFENTGGQAKWEAVQGLKTTAKLNMQGMDLPLNIIQLKDGRQMTFAAFQGMQFYQEVFDGSTLWGTNQMTMKAEKSDAETTENFKANLAGDFISPFLNYKKKGYTVELLGKETMEGSEVFKIKLTKKPIKVDGKETENVEFYYFDAADYVPILSESELKSGPGKGTVLQNKMSDYQDVNGLMFPFSMTVSAKGQTGGQTINITAIEINPKVEASVFAFPTSGN